MRDRTIPPKGKNSFSLYTHLGGWVGIVWLLLAPLFSSAQEFKPLSDPGKLTTALEAQGTVSTFYAQFSEIKTLSFMDGEMNSSGFVAFSSEGSIRWEYQKPKNTIMLITPNGTKLKEGGKVKELKGAGGIMKKIQELIGGCISGEILNNRNYESKFYGSENGFKVILVPQQRRIKQMAANIEVVFDRTTLIIRSVLMTDASGDTTYIVFSESEVNTELPKGAFKLD